jgi:CRP/FNR family transcriptional regulator, anaerobic regulatory protein
MWQEYIFKLYHQRFEELLGIVNEIAYKRMDERIFQYLIQKQQLLHTNTLNITHQQIADDLSTSRVVVSRLLKVLEQEQKLKLFRNKIELCN